MRFILFITGIWLSLNVAAQPGCTGSLEPYKSGEKISYDISYNLGPVWLTAGHVTFTANKEEYSGRKVWHFKGKGGTYKGYDWIYKVRDTYESWALPRTLEPIKFIRNVKEGKTIIYNEYKFFPKRREAYVNWYDGENSGKDTIDFPACHYDVMTAIYHCRSINYQRYQEGDTIPLNLMLDRKVEPTYLRYIGKDTFTTREGKIDIACFKFKPLLIEGTIFEAGEDMTVWVSADVNMIPVYVESKILVGKIKAYLTEATGLHEEKDYR